MLCICGDAGGRQLIKAASSGNADVVQEILESRPDLASSHTVFSSRYNMLHQAAASGNAEVLRAALLALHRPHLGTSAAGASRSRKNKFLRAAIDGRTTQGQTPLMLACKLGHVACVKLLLDNGCNPLAVDTDKQRSAVHHAAFNKRARVLKLLLADSTVVSARERILPLKDAIVGRGQESCRYLDSRSEYGLTALHLAAAQGSLACVEVLLAAGARLTLRTTSLGSAGKVLVTRGSTPLHIAAQQGSLPIIQELLQAVVNTQAALPRDGSAGDTQRRLWEQDVTVDLRSIPNSLQQLPYHVAFSAGQVHAARAVNPTVPIDRTLENMRHTNDGVGPHSLVNLAGFALRRGLLAWLEQLQQQKSAGDIALQAPTTPPPSIARPSTGRPPLPRTSVQPAQAVAVPSSAGGTRVEHARSAASQPAGTAPTHVLPPAIHLTHGASSGRSLCPEDDAYKETSRPLTPWASDLHPQPLGNAAQTRFAALAEHSPVAAQEVYTEPSRPLTPWASGVLPEVAPPARQLTGAAPPEVSAVHCDRPEAKYVGGHYSAAVRPSTPWEVDEVAPEPSGRHAEEVASEPGQQPWNSSRRRAAQVADGRAASASASLQGGRGSIGVPAAGAASGFTAATGGDSTTGWRRSLDELINRRRSSRALDTSQLRSLSESQRTKSRKGARISLRSSQVAASLGLDRKPSSRRAQLRLFATPFAVESHPSNEELDVNFQRNLPMGPAGSYVKDQGHQPWPGKAARLPHRLSNKSSVHQALSMLRSASKALVRVSISKTADALRALGSGQIDVGCEEDTECGICLESEPKVAVEGCYHRLCVDCAIHLCQMKKGPPTCPFCRALVLGFHQVLAA